MWKVKPLFLRWEMCLGTFNRKFFLYQNSKCLDFLFSKLKNIFYIGLKGILHFIHDLVWTTSADFSTILTRPIIVYYVMEFFPSMKSRRWWTAKSRTTHRRASPCIRSWTSSLTIRTSGSGYRVICCHDAFNHISDF